MTVPSVACTNCGKPFTTDDLRGTSCRYCGTLLAHHARAQQQIAVVQGMLQDRNGNGIPDAYEGLVANAQVHPFAPQGHGRPPAWGPSMHAQMHTARTVQRTILFVVIGAIALSLIMGILGVVVFVLAG